MEGEGFLSSHRCAADDSSLRPAPGRHRVRGGGVLGGRRPTKQPRGGAAGVAGRLAPSCGGRRLTDRSPRAGRMTVSACLFVAGFFFGWIVRCDLFPPFLSVIHLRELFSLDKDGHFVHVTKRVNFCAMSFIFFFCSVCYFIYFFISWC